MPHPTRRIEHGSNYAEVDIPVADLVLALWEAGYETIGSCQDGWVQMPGSEAFRWQNNLRDKASLVHIDFGSIPSGRDPHRSAPKVRFEPQDIPALTRAIRGASR